MNPETDKSMFCFLSESKNKKFHPIYQKLRHKEPVYRVFHHIFITIQVASFLKRMARALYYTLLAFLEPP